MGQFTFQARIDRLRELAAAFSKELANYDKQPGGLLGQHGFVYGGSSCAASSSRCRSLPPSWKRRDGKRPVYRPKPKWTGH